MKILHIISSPGAGGAEVYVKDLSQKMVLNGHEVFILFLNSAKDIGIDHEFEKKFLIDLKENEISYDFIGYKARKNIFFGIKRIRSLIAMINPDIVHCHLYYAAIYSLFTNNKNIIYTHHNIKLGAPKLLYKILDLRIKTYIGICYACKKMLEKIVKKPVIQINNGVNIKKIIRKKIDHTNKPIKIIFVGRLSKQKNIDLLLKALKIINYKDVTLEIAGEGREKERLENLVKELSLTESVKFLGNQSNIPDLLHKADIFAMSSSYEGLPIALIEATLTGLPCIVTNVGGSAEIIHQAMNGIVIDDINDPQEYANGLKRLIESKELRNQLSRNALNYSNKYEINIAAEEHIKIYKNIYMNN